MTLPNEAAPKAAVTVETQLSYELLFRAEFPNVVRDAYFVLGDREAALEVAQEAFTRLVIHWKKVSRYDRPGAWVRRVAIRLATRTRFRSYKEAELFTVEELSTDEIPAIYIDVRRAVMQLPRTQRAAIFLHYYHDLSIEEVANNLGCKNNTAKAHLHKARLRLGQLLKDKEQNNVIG